jgi:transcription termination factor Rho
VTTKTINGLLELDGHRGGFLRTVSLEMERRPGDLHIGPDLIRQYRLREACWIEAEVGDAPAQNRPRPGNDRDRNRGGGRNGNRQWDRGTDRRGPKIEKLLSVNGLTPTDWAAIEEFSGRTAVDPSDRIKLSPSGNDISMRIVDLVCPLGKGQRALIVSPPKAGKTILMQNFAQAISTNHPEIDLIVLLVDERPEEVTDMRRTIRGEVFASSNDSDRESHVRLARLILEYAKRKVETGKDVVLLLDSLTRMGRAFNAVQRSSGRTMSGGVDIRALEIPKKIFGAARALEGAGSLTIIATALIETNSRMDELIFQEFKGTGNMELVLSRDLANERIFPAINISLSGTRREELLFGGDTRAYQSLRRALSRMKPREAMLLLQKAVGQYSTNDRLLAHVSREKEFA